MDPWVTIGKAQMDANVQIAVGKIIQNLHKSSLTLTRLVVAYGRHEGKEERTKYLPHAAYVAGLSAIHETTSASLLGRVGRCQEDHGQYSVAQTEYRQASLLREKMLGIEHLSTLTNMNDLALMLNR